MKSGDLESLGIQSHCFFSCTACCLILIPAHGDHRCLITDIGAAKELDEEFILQNTVQRAVKQAEVSDLPRQRI